ncbi:MAG: Bax inhibitor-1/YccA family protein [Desulfobacterales bacterium]|nr:Bax inhibitor-1/YccA family protein [Desulfobacterales bacterium]
METEQLRRTQTNVFVNEFIWSVYNWMAIGLAVTGFMAYMVANSPSALKFIFGNQLVFIGLIIGELGLVYYLSARINRIEAGTATAMFLFYSALNGVTLSVIFIIYTAASITSTFFICTATFVVCSVYGMTTKKDLTSIGSFMFMGLIGIIIASVVNWFLQSSLVNYVISYIGIIVFVGLTAYDSQNLKNMAQTQPVGANEGVLRKGAILGALTLYLDFINLFLMLLRLFGNRD